MSDQGSGAPRDPDDGRAAGGGDRGDHGDRADGDDHGDLVLRDHADREPSWLSTYGSPLFRIALLVVLLAALIIFRKPCADGVAGFVGNFGQPAGQAMPRDAAARH